MSETGLLQFNILQDVEARRPMAMAENHGLETLDLQCQYGTICMLLELVKTEMKKLSRSVTAEPSKDNCANYRTVERNQMENAYKSKDSSVELVGKFSRMKGSPQQFRLVNRSISETTRQHWKQLQGRDLDVMGCGGSFSDLRPKTHRSLSHNGEDPNIPSMTSPISNRLNKSSLLSKIMQWENYYSGQFGSNISFSSSFSSRLRVPQVGIPATLSDDPNFANLKKNRSALLDKIRQFECFQSTHQSQKKSGARVKILSDKHGNTTRPSQFHEFARRTSLINYQINFKYEDSEPSLSTRKNLGVQSPEEGKHESRDVKKDVRLLKQPNQLEGIFNYLKRENPTLDSPATEDSASKAPFKEKIRVFEKFLSSKVENSSAKSNNNNKPKVPPKPKKKPVQDTPTPGFHQAIIINMTNSKQSSAAIHQKNWKKHKTLSNRRP